MGTKRSATIARRTAENQGLTDEMKAAQFHMRSLIDSNVDALATTDPLGVITDVNPQMCALTGRRREELIGSAFKDYFTDPIRAEDGIRQVLTDGRVTNYELTMSAKDGGKTIVSYNATTLRDAEGRLRGVFAAARDITDQKQLEESLRQVQTYTRGLIEASVDGLVTVDPELLVSDVNEQMSRMTGYARDELIGSPFTDYFTDPEAAAAGVRQTLEQGYVTNYVLVLRSRIGNERAVSFNASVFKDTAGDVRGIFASARDITEQQRLEEELREQQTYTRGLIESSVDAMITVNPDLTITDVNEQMVKLTEVVKASLIGSRFQDFFTEPRRAADGVRQTLRQGFVTNYELTLRTPSGREVLVSFNASVYKDAAGAVRGIYAIARDVTEQRRLEEQLREQQNYSRALIEASVDALVTVSPTGLITDVNEQMVRLTGHGRQQLVGRPFAELFTEPDRATDGVKLTFADGIVKNYELVVRAKSGVETRVSFNAAVFRDTAGNVDGIFAAARDITDQKGLEDEIREQQTYNRGLIDSNIDALMTTDALGIITDVNPQMCAMTGCTRDELIGSAFKGYFTDPRRAEDGVRRVITEGRVINYELTLRAKDGKETTVSYNATTFTGSDGRLRGVFAAARDITDQKRLEEDLRQAQNYNRGLIESSVDAMLTVDPELTVTDVNEQMVRLAGYARDQLIGSSFQDYFTEPDRAIAGVRQTLAEGFVTNYELTLRSRHRRQILVSFNASVYKDTEGRVRGIYAIARDVTEQRRLEEQLREQQHYNRGLIESSVDALVTVDPDVTITDVNEQMVRLTGYTREELVGSPFRDYFTEPSRAAAGVRQTLAEGSVTNYELVLRARSGKRTVVSFSAGTFKDTEGRVAGILAAARDITNQKRLAEDLRDQQTYNRGLIESSVDALMTVAPDGVITDVNEQTVRLSGNSRRRLIGQPLRGLLHRPRACRRRGQTNV
ncbi:MAG: PAS domain S-box protein [Chloroflexota bacterium]|nr:MAG: PAS domain S-box protein [Chloroflexota bacterium]